MTKTCPKCKKEKEKSEYYPAYGRGCDGLAWMCKQCYRDYARAARKK